jgi:hypothetical protein
MCTLRRIMCVLSGDICFCENVLRFDVLVHCRKAATIDNYYRLFEVQ